jgi:hypothetical protein
MFDKYYPKVGDGDRLSEEALLPEDVPPNRNSHTCLSVKRTLAIHAGILGLYTFLFLVAWRLLVKNSYHSVQPGSEIYSNSQPAP